ncbi:MbtH family NRPS accessory protein [Streptomyces bambusae]|uniref:MbtH family protein n=1 Tax=Streptomyces bambusae TaxID=1550616 RepID=UPI001CFF2FEF|nr:MbtH family NRPS accessory protein [Streptomyces bambusae]MCB5166111.1 MbtH family NRPS accessory protein [Streptomyces bambusae]
MSTTDRCVVVVNHEEQYSVWPAGRDLPAGWARVGDQGTRQECLTRIEELWTDMTPASVRRSLAARTPGAGTTGGRAAGARTTGAPA